MTHRTLVFSCVRGNIGRGNVVRPGMGVLGQSRLLSDHRQMLSSVNRGYHSHLRVSRMYPAVNLNVDPRKSSKEKCQSSKLMTSYGFLHGASAGTFALLPQTSRAVEKLYRLIDQEMARIGGQKIQLPCLSHPEPWIKSGRREEMMSELLTVQDRHQSLLSPTHEEAVTSLVAASCPVSYRSLPIRLYQIGRKFRDEKRPKHGLLRCREFEMKDLYTFDEDLEKAQENYDAVLGAYHEIFTRMGLDYLKVEASVGAMGGHLSHEFQLVADAGEDTLVQCSKCGKNRNFETLTATSGDGVEKLTCGQADCDERDHKVTSGIEVAHAFILGTRYSDVFRATFTDANKQICSMEMGCFGIGVTRLLAAGIEVLSTESQIRWPRLIAPHLVCIVPQKEGYRHDETLMKAESLQKELSSLPNLFSEVVLDDRHKLSIGRRVREASSLGYPYVIAVGNKALEDAELYEFIDIYQDKKEYMTQEDILKKLAEVETITLP